MTYTFRISVVNAVAVRLVSCCHYISVWDQRTPHRTVGHCRRGKTKKKKSLKM